MLDGSLVPHHGDPAAEGGRPAGVVVQHQQLQPAAGRVALLQHAGHEAAADLGGPRHAVTGGQPGQQVVIAGRRAVHDADGDDVRHGVRQVARGAGQQQVAG